MNKIKLLLGALCFSVFGLSAVMPAFAKTSCNAGGDASMCANVCDPTGWDPCSYMDCGSGTEMCHGWA